MVSIKMVLLVFVLSFVVSAFGPTEGFSANEVEHACNRHLLEKDGEEEENINSLLVSLTAQASHGSFNEQNTLNGYYGSVSCNTALPKDACENCLVIARNNLIISCGYADGAQIKLDDCQVRYEHYRFF